MQFIMDLISIVAGKLEETAQSDVVVGEPIVLGGVTIVPLSRLTVALGGIGGEGEGEAPRHRRHKGGRGKGRGEVTGLGAKVRPVAVAIFSEEGVEVLPIADRKGVLDKIMEKVPEVIELVKKAQEKAA